jgi:hypothetical protein
LPDGHGSQASAGRPAPSSSATAHATTRTGGWPTTHAAWCWCHAALRAATDTNQELTNQEATDQEEEQVSGQRDGRLYRVVASSFTAGIVVGPSGTIVDVAPILGQWRREPLDDLRRYAASHGWTVEVGEVVTSQFKPGYARIKRGEHADGTPDSQSP